MLDTNLEAILKNPDNCKSNSPYMMKNMYAKYYGIVPYTDGLNLQKNYHQQIVDGAKDTLLLMQHPNIYTLGRRGKESDILIDSKELSSLGIEIQHTDRGGEVTYHGPGQIIVYPIINIKKSGIKPVDYINTLITGIKIFLSSYGIQSDNHSLTGVWVTEKKIASLGVKVSKGVTKHGLAININTDLSYFENIIACGIENSVPTSLSKILNREITVNDTYKNLVTCIGKSFDMEVSWQN